MILKYKGTIEMNCIFHRLKPLIFSLLHTMKLCSSDSVGFQIISHPGLCLNSLLLYFTFLTEGCRKEQNWCCSVCSILEWNHKESEGGRLCRWFVSFILSSCYMTYNCFRLLESQHRCCSYVMLREMELLHMPKNSRGLSLVQWPLFLLASKVCWCL